MLLHSVGRAARALLRRARVNTPQTVRAVALFLSTVAGLCGCDVPSSDTVLRCTRLADCPGGQYCLSGVCRHLSEEAIAAVRAGDGGKVADYPSGLTVVPPSVQREMVAGGGAGVEASSDVDASSSVGGHGGVGGSAGVGGRAGA